MKVGIITYHNVINYGAALQAFALQKCIDENGADVSIINYVPTDVFSIYKPFCLFRYLKTLKRSVPIAIRELASDIKHFRSIKRKNIAFLEFGNNYFKYSCNRHTNFDDLKNEIPDYDLCFAGSDQIWNPDITYGFDPAYFLDFGKENMVRASYAASIGRDEFLEQEKKDLSEYLKKFDFISVREKSAADIINKITDIPVEVVLDPTLLLTPEKWSESLSLNINKGRYILVYTLYPNTELDKFVERISTIKKLPVITMNRKKVYSNEIDSFPEADPKKFAELIANADFVVTNSFHGTAFSVNFSKNFITFTGSRRNSRITDLLNTLGISERAVAEYSEELLDIPDINYKSVQSILENEREKSKNYIKKVFERAKND